MSLPSLIGVRAGALLITVFFSVAAAIQYLFVRLEVTSVVRHELREQAAKLSKEVDYKNGIDPAEFNKAATGYSEYFATLNDGTILSFDMGDPPMPRDVMPSVEPLRLTDESFKQPTKITYQYDQRSKPEVWTLLAKRLDKGLAIVGLSEYDKVDDAKRESMLEENIVYFGDTLERARHIPQRQFDNELSWAVIDGDGHLVSGIGRIPLRTNAIEVGKASQRPGRRDLGGGSYYVVYDAINDGNGKTVGTAILFEDIKYLSLALTHLTEFDIAVAAISGIVFLLLTSFYEQKHEAEKREIRRAFQNYFSPQVMEAILREPERLKLGGQRREITVLFSDIRSFTALSEGLPPQELTRILQEYFDEMADAVLATDGILDKYIGDAIMAFWGAPIEQADQANRAVKTALDMTQRLERLQKKWRGEGLPLVDVGIGINLGIATVGNFGSSKRFDYTAIGDTVNAASRIEALNKEYRSHIIISESTKSQLTIPLTTRDLGDVHVRGKDKPIRVFEVLLEEQEVRGARESTVAVT